MVAYAPDAESLARYAPAPPKKKGRKQDNSLEEFLQDRTRSLAGILHDVRQDVDERHSLCDRIIASVYQQYLYIKAKLIELYQIPIGASRSVEGRRSALEKQLDQLKQESRQERARAWQDVARLKAELRTWFKQYADLAQRVRLVLSGKRKQ